MAYSHLVRTANGCSLYGMLGHFLWRGALLNRSKFSHRRWNSYRSSQVPSKFSTYFDCQYSKFAFSWLPFLLKSVKLYFFFLQILLSCTCTTDMMACPLRYLFLAAHRTCPIRRRTGCGRSVWRTRAWRPNGVALATSGTLGERGDLGERSAWVSTRPPGRCRSPELTWSPRPG